MAIRNFFLPLLLLAWTSAASAETFIGSCTIRFSGESTLHGFTGQAACQPFVLAVEKDANGIPVLHQPQVEVAVPTMTTANASRDQKMYGMFDSARYPLIRGQFPDRQLATTLAQLGGDEKSPGRLDFILQIRDIRQPVVAQVRQLQTSPERITFALEFPLSLASYQLQPPSVLGLIRVDDMVQVAIDVDLQRR